MFVRKFPSNRYAEYLLENMIEFATIADAFSEIFHTLNAVLFVRQSLACQHMSLKRTSNEICILQIVVAQCICSCICIRICSCICICDNQFASIYIIYAAQILLAIKAIQMSFVMH